MDHRLRLIAKKRQETLRCNTCIYYHEFRDDYCGWCCLSAPVPYSRPHPEENGFISIQPQVDGTSDWCGEHTTELDIHADEEWFKTRLEEANKKVKQLS